MSSLLRLTPQEYLYKARTEKLRLSQMEFAEYINKNNKIKISNLSQSTVSKYESGSYNIPSQLLLVCQDLLILNNSLLEYPIESLIDSIKSLDPINDFLLLEFIDEAVTKFNKGF